MSELIYAHGCLSQTVFYSMDSLCLIERAAMNRGCTKEMAAFDIALKVANPVTEVCRMLWLYSVYWHNYLIQTWAIISKFTCYWQQSWILTQASHWLDLSHHLYVTSESLKFLHLLCSMCVWNYQKAEPSWCWMQTYLVVVVAYLIRRWFRVTKSVRTILCFCVYGVNFSLGNNQTDLIYY